MRAFATPLLLLLALPPAPAAAAASWPAPVQGAALEDPPRPPPQGPSREHAAQLRSREAVRAVEAALGRGVNTHYAEQALVAGDVPTERLAQIAAGLERARAWFDGALACEPGLALLGGRPGEVWAWARDRQPYVDSVPHFAAQGRWLPPGWAEAAQRTHGFVYWDPWPVSSAWQGHRPDEHLAGHCYNHWGHALLNRLGYDGKLLPPWYDEGFAALCELRTHGRITVHSVQGRGKETTGSSARAADYDLDPAAVRRGEWVEVVKQALADDRVPRFDRLARLAVSELAALERATALAVLVWLEERPPTEAGRPALRAFHDVLRARAPAAPLRVPEQVSELHATYDEAFRAAVGLSWSEADEAWRAWLRAL